MTQGCGEAGVQCDCRPTAALFAMCFEALPHVQLWDSQMQVGQFHSNHYKVLGAGFRVGLADCNKCAVLLFPQQVAL